MRYKDEQPAPPINLTPEQLKAKIKSLEIEHYGRVVTCWPEDESPLYLIARRPRFGERTGSIAWRTTGGKELADFLLDVSRAFPGIEIMTISGLETYGEYGPYNIVETKADFERAVRKLSRKGKKRR